jgi:hypothetical protein
MQKRVFRVKVHKTHRKVLKKAYFLWVFYTLYQPMASYFLVQATIKQKPIKQFQSLSYHLVEQVSCSPESLRLNKL